MKSIKRGNIIGLFARMVNQPCEFGQGYAMSTFNELTRAALSLRMNEIMQSHNHGPIAPVLVDIAFDHLQSGEVVKMDFRSPIAVISSFPSVQSVKSVVKNSQ